MNGAMPPPWEQRGLGKWASFSWASGGSYMDAFSDEFPEQWIAVVIDESARQQGFERGEMLAHGNWIDIGIAVREYHRKYPTSPVGLFMTWSRKRRASA